MRSLDPDAEHFAFLDETAVSGTINTVLAASCLVRVHGSARLLRREEAGWIAVPPAIYPRYQKSLIVGTKPADCRYCECLLLTKTDTAALSLALLS